MDVTGPEVEHLRTLARRTVVGRRLLLATEVLASLTPLVETATALGAGPMLALATAPGFGPQPAIESILVDIGPTTDYAGAMHRTTEVFAAPPADVSAAIDRFDPEHTGRGLLNAFQAGDSIAGRVVYGPRRPEWVRLEDKLTINELLDSAGVARPPAINLGLTDAAGLLTAHRRLDAGSGTIMAVDASQGFHGGGVGLRRVVDEARLADATGELGRRGTRVRMATFVEGLPCSIHGCAVPGAPPMVMRPVELLTLRSSVGLHYAGVSTVWDPGPEVTDDMARVADRVGRALGEQVDFRGWYTVDGVLGADGFVVTEVNPRPGAGLFWMFHAVPEMNLVQRALTAGETWDFAPRVIGPWLRDVFAGTRAVRSNNSFEKGPSGPLDIEVEAGVLHLAPTGGRVYGRAEPDLGAHPPGRPVAPLVAMLLDQAQSEIDLGLPPLTAATAVG